MKRIFATIKSDCKCIVSWYAVHCVSLVGLFLFSESFVYLTGVQSVRSVSEGLPGEKLRIGLSNVDGPVAVSVHLHLAIVDFLHPVLHLIFCHSSVSISVDLVVNYPYKPSPKSRLLPAFICIQCILALLRRGKRASNAQLDGAIHIHSLHVHKSYIHIICTHLVAIFSEKINSKL